MKDRFADYTLAGLGGGHYHLRPSVRGYGGDVYISFLPGDHIAVYGDYCPGRIQHANNGVVSAPGYGLGWFSEKKDASYLAGKFYLEKVFQPTKAAQYCRSRATDEAEAGSPELQASLNELAADADGLEQSDVSAVAAWIERLTDLEDSESVQACYGYSRGNLDLLVAIQHAFAGLIGKVVDAPADITALGTLLRKHGLDGWKILRAGEKAGHYELSGNWEGNAGALSELMDGLHRLDWKAAGCSVPHVGLQEGQIGLVWEVRHD